MIKRSFAGLAGAALLTGCVMPPQGVTPQDLQFYDEAVASVGCTMVGESDYLPVELQTGLTREQVLEVSQYKLAVEEAVQLENGGIKLVTGACA